MRISDWSSDVCSSDLGIDDGKAGIRKFLGDLGQGVRLGEADAEDGVGAALRHAAQRLLALGLVGDLELAVLDTGFLLEPLDDVVDALAEGLVELADHVDAHCGLDLRRTSQGGRYQKDRSRTREMS